MENKNLGRYIPIMDEYEEQPIASQTQTVKPKGKVASAQEAELLKNLPLPIQALMQPTRAIKAGVESGLGLPGELINLGLTIGKKGTEYITGQEFPGFPTKGPLPTSEDIREKYTDPLTESIGPAGINKPKNELQSKLDDFYRDATSLMFPIPGAARIPFKKAAQFAGAGNLAEWGTHKVLGEKKGQEWGGTAKIGTMFISSMGGTKHLTNHMRALSEKARSAIPEGATISIEKIKPMINSLESISFEGLSMPDRERIGTIIRDIKSKTAGNYIPLREAVAIKEDIGKIAFQEIKDPGKRELLKPLANQFNKVIIEEGKHYPKFLKPWQERNDIYAGMVKDSALRSWLKQNVSGEKLSSTFIKGITHGNWKSAIATTLGLGSLQKAENVIENIMRSRSIQNKYMKMITAAAAKNVPAASRAAQELDKEFTKEMPTFGRYIPIEED